MIFFSKNVAVVVDMNWPSIKLSHTKRQSSTLTALYSPVQPPIIANCLCFSPSNLPIIFLSTNTVCPSLSQKSSQLLLVTRLPVQLCEISCAITEVADLSPAYRETTTYTSHYIYLCVYIHTYVRMYVCAGHNANDCNMIVKMGKKSKCSNPKK